MSREYRRTGERSEVVHRVDFDRQSGQVVGWCEHFKGKKVGKHCMDGDSGVVVTCVRCRTKMWVRMKELREQLGLVDKASPIGEVDG